MNTPRKDYVAMIEKWQRMRDCREGSDAVKAAGEKYLPRLACHKGKTASRYDSYKLRALFFNATRRTVEGLAGALLQKAPTFDVPAKIKGDLEDVTLGGVSAEMFGLNATREVFTTARFGVLVEMPAETASDLRPYWVGYRAEDVVSWTTRRLRGDQILTRVIVRESVEEENPADPFAPITCEQYRVLELAGDTATYQQTVWRKKGGKTTDEWEPYGDPIIPVRRGERLTFIPFVFIGAVSVSADVENPPLLDLADVNLSHYRTMADLEHGRHWTALPTPWIAGQVNGSAESQEPLSIGSEEAWVLEKDGKAGMLEYTGEGLGALEKADEQKRKMMATLGARLLEEQSSTPETMGAVSMRHSGEHATLRTIAGSIEQGLTMVVQWHAWWVGLEALPADTKATVELNKEFFALKASPDEIRVALLAWQGGGMSFATWYERLQKGYWAREDVTAEEELAEIDAETPAPPDFTPNPEPPPDPNAPPPPPAGGPPTPPGPTPPQGGMGA